MKKVFFALIFLYSTFLYAEIDERKSDVYFVNGIDTTEEKAIEAKNELEKQTKKSFPQTYKQVAEWKINYNRTRGFEADIYESAIQKLYQKLNEDKTWEIAGATAYIFDATVGSIPGVKDVIKGAISYTGKKLGKKKLKELLLDEVKDTLSKKGINLSKEDIAFLSEEIFDSLLDELLDGIKDETIDDINKDIETHHKAYNKSIEDGHSVIIVSHSQGNFYTNFIVDGYQGNGHSLIADWQKQYIHTLGVAAPTSSIANGGGYITFDNDVIQAVPGHLGWNVKNPKRYKLSNTNTETFISVEAHSFLESYMATDSTKNTILGFIDGAITTHNTADSQWKKSKEFGCGCKKRMRVVHKEDDSLNVKMAEVDVVKFDEELKLYPIEGQYYKGIYEGDSVQDHTQEQEGELCMELLASTGSIVDEFLGKVKESNPNSGVVEISLKWDNEEVDLDLNVAWSAGSVDVKDICDPFEHFHIRSEATIYPGTYGVSIIPKNTKIIKIKQYLTSIQGSINYNFKQQKTQTTRTLS
jgi:hypothetical protein